jgi:RNA polymerase sigma-70 factor (ECF subfamily)
VLREREPQDQDASSEPEVPDVTLVQRAAQGDREAYRGLFDRYHSRIFAMSYELLRSREDAQDVTQEAFVKAYLSLADFKGESAFYTWLYRIAYNLVIDLKRKVTRRGGPASQFEESTTFDANAVIGTVAGQVEGPHQTLFRKQQQDLLHSALSSLSDEHRATIVLREMDGFSYEEIADTTGVSVGTVMSRLFYARKKLQKVLLKLAPELGYQGGSAAPEEASEGAKSPILGRAGLKGMALKLVTVGIMNIFWLTGV